jgi:hypothetical protein
MRWVEANLMILNEFGPKEPSLAKLWFLHHAATYSYGASRIPTMIAPSTVSIG